MKLNNKKKIILGSILGILLGSLISITYAIFSYTRTGQNQQLIVGDIYMHYKESNSLDFSNALPQNTYTEGKYFEFTVDGKNTYTEKDIVYDIVLNYGDNPSDATRTIRIRDELLRFRLVEVVNNLEQEIFNNRSYINFNNTRIHKSTIPADTKNEITHRYRIYAWISNDTVIGNTDDADYSQNDWNKVFASIKVSVTGDFEDKVVPKPLYDVVKTDAVSDATISNLYAKEGVGNFLRSTTASDTYPVYYYRGAVENNNLVFANKCWKIVRTTETGGTKLIYNGEIESIYEKVALTQDKYTIVTNTDGTNENVWTFDSTDNSWNASTSGSLELSFKVPAGNGYIMEVTGNFSSSGGGFYTFFKDGTSIGGYGGNAGATINYPFSYGTLTVDNVVKYTFSGGGSVDSPNVIKIRMLTQGALITSNGCDNIGNDAQLSTTSFQDTDKYKSPAYVGYNYGQVYELTNQSKSGTYGNGVSWDGSKYSLTNTSSFKDANHHYICEDTNCTSVRYYYYSDYYISLTGGDTVETALEKMLTKSSDTNKSNIRNTIESWYNENIKTTYGKYVEDTKWCMDRSVTGENLEGWNPNNVGLLNSSSMNFDVRKRVETASASNPPQLTCSNQNDVMTVKNGKLDSPVALLTYDEASLAGAQFNASNSSSYLITGNYYWLLSPSYFNSGNAYVGYVSSANLGDDIVSDTGGGVRPSLSLKPGTLVNSGTGTVVDPYILATEN